MSNKPLPERLQQKWMSSTEACEALGMSRTTLWRKRNAGVLVGEKYNGNVIISRASVDKYLRQYERGVV